jgi:phage terminase small subunit
MSDEIKEQKPKRKLTLRQRKFVEEFLHCWNASEAARRAGYKSKANVIGSELLAIPSIRAEIDARIAERAMSADEVLDRLAQHARGDFSPFLREDGSIDLMSEQAKAAIGLLKKVKVKERILFVGHGDKQEPVKEIETEIELHDPQAALVHLGRHLKLFTDKAEVSGPDGGAIPLRVTEVVVELPKELGDGSGTLDA